MMSQNYTDKLRRESKYNTDEPTQVNNTENTTQINSHRYITQINPHR